MILDIPHSKIYIRSRNTYSMSMSELKPRSLSDYVSLISIATSFCLVIYVFTTIRQDVDMLKAQNNAIAVQDLRERMARVETKLDIALSHRDK